MDTLTWPMMKLLKLYNEQEIEIKQSFLIVIVDLTLVVFLIKALQKDKEVAFLEAKLRISKTADIYDLDITQKILKDHYSSSCCVLQNRLVETFHAIKCGNNGLAAISDHGIMIIAVTIVTKWNSCELGTFCC